MKIYDISQEVFTCSVYPGDPVPEKRMQSSILDGDACNLTVFSMCAHNGTHIDAPFHFIQEGKTVEQINLSRVVGYAYVADAPQVIGADEMKEIINKAKNCSDEAAKRILLKGSGEIDAKAAEVLKKENVLLIGTELQTVGPEKAPAEVHLLLLSDDTVLLEGIRLTDVPEGKYLLCAAPLNLGGADGAPVRAVLLDLEE